MKRKLILGVATLLATIAAAFVTPIAAGAVPTPAAAVAVPAIAAVAIPAASPSQCGHGTWTVQSRGAAFTKTWVYARGPRRYYGTGGAYYDVCSNVYFGVSYWDYLSMGVGATFQW